MKVLHLSKFDLGGGGGGFEAAYRLHRNMLGTGVQSKMLVLKNRSGDSEVIPIFNNLNYLKKGVYYFRTILTILKARFDSVKLKLFSRKTNRSYFFNEKHGFVTAQDLRKSLNWKPDLIIAHWVSEFIDVVTLYEISKFWNVPVAWYLMDMGPLTGGCHYTMGCNKYMENCGNCPQIEFTNIENDLSRLQWQKRFETIQKMRVIPIVGSTWLQERLIASSIFKNKPYKLIPLGIDSNVFSAGDKQKAKVLLRLPTDKKIIFFGAMNYSEERKGFHLLKKSLEILHRKALENEIKSDDIYLVIAGKGSKDLQGSFFFPSRFAGVINSNNALAKFYQAASIFVCPSIEDAGPMMINESIMCGTPVVSYDIGVAKDLVISGETGYRARINDPNDFAEGMFDYLFKKSLDEKKTQDRCRSLALKLCDPEVQVNAFKKVFNKL